MINKICLKCEKEKSINEFYKHKRMADGHLNICKKCVLKRIKEYSKNNKVKINEYRKQWRKDNKDKIIKYKLDNIIKVRMWHNRDYSKHKESYLKRANKYYLNNKEIIKENGRIYNNMRRRTNIEYRILCNLRRRLHNAITKGFKSAKTLELLGCSIEYLKQYLEKQFKKGMNWDNYKMDGWHIDHIIPCNSFDLTNPEEQVKCFNYKNLQPLWAKENRIKHTNIL